MENENVAPQDLDTGKRGAHHDAMQLPIRAAKADVAMELYATGFNAWNQLIFDHSAIDDEPDDIFVFTKVLSRQRLGRPAAHLCYTTVQCDDALCLAGRVEDVSKNVDENKDVIRAESANGAVLIVENATSDAASHTLVKYPSPTTYQARTGGKSWPCRRRVTQIAAYDTGFIILYEDGTVDTLGDPRFEDCLGRDVNETSPADEPGEVVDLSDLGDPIQKVSAGGYIMAALTEGGGLYVWGAESAGSHSRHQAFPEISRVPNYIEVDGEQDVKDIALGESHAIALTSEGNVFVIGSNISGQLSLGKPFIWELVKTWTKVNTQIPPGWEVVGVEAGPRSSFIMASEAKQD
ncbi:Fc.00g032080.m01.CDS01 [Cosmosporella sp. VM-42]